MYVTNLTPPGSGVTTLIPGVDLEEPGALEAMLAARARGSDKEIMLLAVGDTRDHRRVDKDPALRIISIGFVTSLIANLRWGCTS
jgi:hypothetical protein